MGKSYKTFLFEGILGSGILVAAFSGENLVLTLFRRGLAFCIIVSPDQLRKQFLSCRAFNYI